MSTPAIISMIVMLTIYFGGFIYFATRENPNKN